MPRFFLNQRNTLDVTDEEGVDLPDLEAARTVASGRLVLDQTRCLEARRIDIEDEEGRVVDTVWFRDVVTIEG
jgi:hypothetical protein